MNSRVICWLLVASCAAALAAEAMYYPQYHAARRKSCACGAEQWLMFESKCGRWERVEHVWNQLDQSYGAPGTFYQ